MNTKISGAMGEAYVAEYFRKKRYKLLAMNYRCHMGEIDLIVAKRKKLSFVEVKLRKSDRFGQAAEAVTAEKQRKLRATAELYLAEQVTGLQPRFDVAEVYAPQGMQTKEPIISYIENAF
jgi:putative endonuclease